MSEPTSSQTVIEQLGATIASGRLELPMLPAVATQILASVDGDDCDARSLAELAQRDPSLATHVLRVANSALYAPTEPVVSLTQAIGRLGLTKLRQLVFSIAVRAAVFKVAGHESYVGHLWRHAQVSGRLAQEIARVSRSDVEAAFLCGLLHDIGTPVVLQSLVDQCRKDDVRVEPALIEEAVELFHTSVGARLVDEWRLPEWVREAALYHHRPDAANAHHDLVHTAALADVMGDWLIQSDGEGIPPGLEHAEALHLGSRQFEQLCANATDILAESAA